MNIIEYKLLCKKLLLDSKLTKDNTKKMSLINDIIYLEDYIFEQDDLYESILSSNELNNYYSYLEEEYTKYTNYILKNTKYFKDLSLKIIEVLSTNKITIEPTKSNNYNESKELDILGDYLGQNNYNLYKIFINLATKHNIIYNNDLEEVSGQTTKFINLKEYIIDLKKNNNLDDILTLIHELGHISYYKYIRKYRKLNIINNIYNETYAIISEDMYKKYLESINYPDINIYINHELNYIYTLSLEVYFISDLILKGDTTIEQGLLRLKPNKIITYQEETKNLIEPILKEGNYVLELSYFIGEILSYYLINKLYNPLKDSKDIIRRFESFTPEEVLKKLNAEEEIPKILKKELKKL